MQTKLAPERVHARRTLAVAGLAHAMHDGLTSTVYLLLPIWQAQFGLGYGALAALRALYVGSLAALQLPSGRLARRFGARTVLALGTLLSAAGYALAGSAGGLAGLCVALALAGAGGSTQHPLASAAVSHAYGKSARGPLGTYNFTGDVGKALLPPAVGLLLSMTEWRNALWAVAALAGVAAGLIALLMPPASAPAADPADPAATAHAGGRGGFGLLLAIGMLDGVAGVIVLLFLPTLLRAKGASLGELGLALSLLFIGGACGKAACGWLGARLGLFATVAVTEIGTAAGILAVIALPLTPSLMLLPLLGVMQNGTSSVLYGTVPELVRGKTVEHAFALFYSGTLGASALVPVLYGWLGDLAGPGWALIAAAVTALSAVPLMAALSPRLAPAVDATP
jgi:FSR family fosmidomycin resistance protein-like MFS transporter